MAARTQFSVATCNLYNLNKAGLTMYGRPGWSDQQLDAKLDWTASALKSMAADVFGFQELWHSTPLREAFKRAGIEKDYEFLIPANHNTGKRIACAAAVHKDKLVGDAVWIRDFPDDFCLLSGGDDAQTDGIAVQIDTFSRPVLRFEVKPRSNGKRITVYVAHLKSKLPTRIDEEPWFSKPKHSRHSVALGAAIATIRRTAEAAALRMIITNKIKNNNEPAVVLGDLNDAQRSNTLNILTGQPNYLLSGRPGGSDTGLYSAGTLQEYRSLRDVYYTHVHQNQRESLDHILVSQEFYDNSKERLWGFKGLTILNDHLNDDDHKANGSSDHAVVRAQFEYRPA